MTHPTMGTAVRLNVHSPADAPRTDAQLAALQRFTDALMSPNAQPLDGAQLRLLFSEIHVQDRAAALQVLEPYRASVRRDLETVATSRLHEHVDELRRRSVRLHEVGRVVDAVDETESVESSAALRAAFSITLRFARSSLDIGARLRETFVRMSPADRASAQTELQTFRDLEQRRIQDITSRENGNVDPSEFVPLRRVASVDAPVEPWEVRSTLAPYSFAAGT